MAGYVKLHRQICDNPLWRREPFTKAQAWIDLFLNANWKPGVIDVRGNIVKIDRGQIGWSELTMAKRWKWSREKVRRFLSYLESESKVRQQKTHITTIITIVNYERYQADETTDETTEKQQKNNRRDTIEEGKESKKRFAPPSKQKVLDFFLANESTKDDAAAYYYHFAERDWTLSNRKKMKSWEMAARKWIHNSKTKYRNNGTTTQEGDPYAVANLKMLAKLERGDFTESDCCPSDAPF